MGALLSVLANIALLGSIVCWILVLVKIFQKGQIGLGIVSIICGIVAFIYGWMKATEWKIQNVMLIWTACIVAGIVFNLLGGGGLVPHMPGG